MLQFMNLYGLAGPYYDIISKHRSKSLFVELWNRGLIGQLIGVHTVGISAWEGARDEILGL